MSPKSSWDTNHYFVNFWHLSQNEELFYSKWPREKWWLFSVKKLVIISKFSSFAKVNKVVIIFSAWLRAHIWVNWVSWFYRRINLCLHFLNRLLSNLIDFHELFWHLDFFWRQNCFFFVVPNICHPSLRSLMFLPIFGQIWIWVSYFITTFKN